MTTENTPESERGDEELSYEQAWLLSYLKYGRELTPLQRARIRRRFGEVLADIAEAKQQARAAGVSDP